MVRLARALVCLATLTGPVSADQLTDQPRAPSPQQPVWSPYRPGSPAEMPVADRPDARSATASAPQSASPACYNAGAPAGAVCCDDPADPCYDSSQYCYQPSYAWPTYPAFPLLSDRLWIRGEYLLWWTEGSRVPPLVTSSPLGTGTPEAGVLGQPGTAIVFGDSRLNSDARSGARFALGLWVDPYRSTAVEATYLFIGQTTDRYRAASQQIPILARPFYDIQGARQSAILIAHPDIQEGSVSAGLSTDFQALEILLRERFVNDGLCTVDALAGYRYNRLAEELSIGQFSRWTVPSLIPVGTTQELLDLFETKSEFHGAELGLSSRFRVQRLSLELLAKLALGNSRSRVRIDGSTITTVPGLDPVPTAGGLLAQDTNRGSYASDQFAVIPELGVTLGYDVTDRLRATFGYTFIYWSRVARPGDQIDFDVNPSQFPPGPLVGPPRPAFTFQTTDFWAQGLNFGLEYAF